MPPAILLQIVVIYYEEVIDARRDLSRRVSYIHGYAQCIFFFPVKRKDNREHFGFEIIHVLNFASRAVF